MFSCEQGYDGAFLFTESLADVLGTKTTGMAIHLESLGSITSGRKTAILPAEFIYSRPETCKGGSDCRH
jgi:hypothetical protein